MPILEFQGKQPRIDKNAFVSPQATIIGDVEIGEFSSVWPGCVIRGDFGKVQIGSYTNIQDGTIIHARSESAPVIIGNFVSVGSNVVMHGCYCGDVAVIGDGAIIFEGATIGEGALVASGSIVAQNTVVPPRTSVAGAPAAQVRVLSREDITRFKENAELIARVFNKLKKWTT